MSAAASRLLTMVQRGLSALLLLWACLLAAGPIAAVQDQPICLIRPVEGSSELQVSQEGIEFLKGVQGHIAPIVVIGPYRSGKSFLLNQLLGVPCNRGFGVGHTRDTQTKGIWIWGQPKAVQTPDGTPVNLLYVDTEGFESTGKANTYDDRIFALSAVMSSLLVYNLPETIRESDIEKLSFAVELAKGFYSRVQGAQSGSLDPGAMLWLIQRDFLQGKTAAQLVASALAPVPNPNHDKDLLQLNRIRESLSTIAGNSTGFGLPQPHLERTKLCELGDAELAPAYLQRRAALHDLVHKLAGPKKVGGKLLSGADLASLVERLVKALNAQDIPNAGSIIMAFNSELQLRALGEYLRLLDAVHLPADNEKLEEAHREGRAAALRVFEEQVLGGQVVGELRATLLTKIKREHSIKETANQAASAKVCGAAELLCERGAEGAAGARFPSLHHFEEQLHACTAAFHAACKGPAKAEMQERLVKAGEAARRAFERDYNDRLFGGLLVGGVAAVVVFRFLLKVAVLEALGWVLVGFLEVYPRLYGGSKSMYQSTWWRCLVQVWEWLMFLGFSFPLAPLVWAALICGGVWYRRQRARRRRRKAAEHPGERDLDV